MATVIFGIWSGISLAIVAPEVNTLTALFVLIGATVSFHYLNRERE